MPRGIGLADIIMALVRHWSEAISYTGARKGPPRFIIRNNR